MRKGNCEKGYCLIIPLFDYGDTVWGDKNNDTLMGRPQVLQNKVAKVLLNLPPRSSSTEALDRLDLKTLSQRRHFHRCVMMQNYLLGEIEDQRNIPLNWLRIVFPLPHPEIQISGTVDAENHRERLKVLPVEKAAAIAAWNQRFDSLLWRETACIDQLGNHSTNKPFST